MNWLINNTKEIQSRKVATPKLIGWFELTTEYVLKSKRVKKTIVQKPGNMS